MNNRHRPVTDPGSLAADLGARAAAELTEVDERVRGRWSSPVTWRQPVHTVYIPADAVTPGVPVVADWAHAGLDTLTSTFPSAGGDPVQAARELAQFLGIPGDRAADVARLTVHKMRTEPIEDLRIDLEDGFTQRGVPVARRDDDEDARAVDAAEVLAGWLDPGSGDAGPRPSFAGVRVRSFDPAVRDRGIRTLVLVLNGLAERGVLSALHDTSSERFHPRALRLTLPKVQDHRQVSAFVRVLTGIEDSLGLTGPEHRPLCFEVQVETPQAVLGAEGEAEAARILSAAEGRCLALHYGTYDYSASMGVDAVEQALDHPVADHAKDVLQVATASVGVELSDGSTNRIPAGDPDAVKEGWRIHHRLVDRHLRRGIRQGWDLHPNQLITRHMATIDYFRRDWASTATRLRDYVSGDTSRWMDEPATAKAMAGYLLRAHACRAVTGDELAAAGHVTGTLRSLQLTGRVDDAMPSTANSTERTKEQDR
ncbi:DUF6986 family protein [Corynebacterium bovis]|uniref:Aldolase n=1 Tax=Corynebacterium bovis TaxID=36808 RepID=A0A426PWP6_9CORY|nr:hypothetical protein [Corynebacterium bovis]MDN8578552.1 hypothetical protein [Corynebacterium bovis]RRO85811.1 hypothetical protein CXF48_09495 [Corynebacterium bovis]RRO89609.1 hypothetical protein CXF30_02800 [Corynebacterium bovis]